MTTQIQTPLQVKTFAPGITVDDLQQSIRLFEGLGFVVDERWEDKGTLLGVMMRAGNAKIGLNQDDWKKGRDRQKGIGMRIFIGTPQDVDEIAARAKAAGVKLDTEPHDTPEGRAFDISDSGFRITIWHEKA
jgi:predicted lactoylglutathione lyase